jgi:hypothetical protein
MAMLLQADGSVLIIIRSGVSAHGSEPGIHRVVTTLRNVVTELKIVFDVESAVASSQAR